MIKKFAIRLKGTDTFLSTKYYGYLRKFGYIGEAQLWSKRHHARLAANYRKEDIEIVEFGVLLIDSKRGYI